MSIKRFNSSDCSLCNQRAVSSGAVSKFTGISTLKDKETDRIKSVDEEILKLESTKIIDSHKDHRMAMSLAPLCLQYGSLQINNPDVVKKSYPNFWKDLEKAGFKITASIC